MGILGPFFSNRKQGDNPAGGGVSWILLRDESQIGELSRNSFQRTQLIYKHSTTCGISSMIRRMLETLLAPYQTDADCYFVELPRFREVSRKVAEDFQLRHESPQLLIIRNGKVVAHESHGAIAEMDFAGQL